MTTAYDANAQAKKARDFLALHHDPALLVLPNVWDPLGARMLESLGFPAVATASAAVAYSLGYDDGEYLTFDAMLGAIARVASAVDVPVSADIERGYADTAEGVRTNVCEAIRAGAVGINLEDSYEEGGPLRPLDDQVARIAAARTAATSEGVPLVINARVDTYIGDVDGSAEELLEMTTSRARAYLEAGADCIFPILMNDPADMKKLHAAIEAPINAFVWAQSPPMRELEAAGVARVSVGPGWIKAGATGMRRAALGLLDGDAAALVDGAMTTEEIRQFVRREKMPPTDSH
jgi:2-methylisocitrate lyase-like PEP mutase family enzyme